MEADSFAASVIAARQADGLLCQSPVYTDVRDFKPKKCAPAVQQSDGILAGFPCQVGRGPVWMLEIVVVG